MKKLNNKGFSLVELIIVIAIMAILVGVVGTQVIPYLENSRKAKDQQVLSAWNTAAMSAYSNAAAKISATQDYTITVKSGSYEVAPTSDTGSASIKNYFTELTGISTGYDFNKMESKAGKSITEVKIEIKSSGEMTLTTTCAAGSGYSFDVIESK